MTWSIIVKHLYPQLMVIGLHGDDTANVVKVVEEARSTEREPVITQHLPAVVNSVQGLLKNQNTAIHKHAPVNTV